MWVLAGAALRRKLLDNSLKQAHSQLKAASQPSTPTQPQKPVTPQPPSATAMSALFKIKWQPPTTAGSRPMPPPNPGSAFSDGNAPNNDKGDKNNESAGDGSTAQDACFGARRFASGRSSYYGAFGFLSASRCYDERESRKRAAE
eukprot:495141-Pleurochrysis_carterae.AAC.1